MPSQTKENYLKALYFLAQDGEEIALTHLSKQMQVSAPTVNSMVKKLQEKGWVIYEKYKPLQLTEEGRIAAALIIRKHRLTEMFLVEKMGFGWEEVHDIAEEMEHIDSEELFDRMDELLGYPSVDPHGSPIPDKDGNVDFKSYSKLSDIEAGSSVYLRALAHSPNDLLVYLNDKELELGSKIKVLKKEPFDGSITILYDENKETMLSNMVSEQLLVEKAS
jgi:DtxR family Mn-dependent transcriptional regulator